MNTDYIWLVLAAAYVALSIHGHYAPEKILERMDEGVGRTVQIIKKEHPFYVRWPVKAVMYWLVGLIYLFPKGAVIMDILMVERAVEAPGNSLEFHELKALRDIQEELYEQQESLQK
jgi:hypothetical protein